MKEAFKGKNNFIGNKKIFSPSTIIIKTPSSNTVLIVKNYAKLQNSQQIQGFSIFKLKENCKRNTLIFQSMGIYLKLINKHVLWKIEAITKI